MATARRNRRSIGRVTQASHPSGHVASWLTLMLMRRRDPSRRRAFTFGQSGIQKAMSLNLPTQAVVVRFAFGARGQRPPQLPPGRLLLAPAIDTPVRTADQIVVVVLRDPAFDQDPGNPAGSLAPGVAPRTSARPQRPGRLLGDGRCRFGRLPDAFGLCGHGLHAPGSLLFNRRRSRRCRSSRTSRHPVVRGVASRLSSGRPAASGEFDRACARTPTKWQVGTQEQAF